MAVPLSRRVAGSAHHPLVLLLHGFPESSWAWQRHLPLLADAGYYVIAPDQRGYASSAKPAHVAEYCLDTLAQDVIALADELGSEQFFLAGHDWGGIVAWQIAQQWPQRVRRLVILNAPHPAVMGPFVLSHPAQLLRSSYIGFFQLPWLPEKILAGDHYRRLRRSLMDTSLPGTFTEADLAQYEQEWSQPGALRAMLHWYRALVRYPSRSTPGKIRVPTRVIWGGRDVFLSRELAAASAARCEQSEVVYLDQCTHWLHHEEPARVNQLLREFLL